MANEKTPGSRNENRNYNNQKQTIMTSTSIKEYIKWVKKLQAAVYIYHESGHIEDFKKWMETEEIVNYLSSYLATKTEEDDFQELLTVCEN